ncbi:META domain-containing protein [Candidatus Poribacteria bacterium]|nr:META domain-containing protein [Candidatus Poribacteria bacterium]
MKASVFGFCFLGIVLLFACRGDEPDELSSSSILPTTPTEVPLDNPPKHEVVLELVGKTWVLVSIGEPDNPTFIPENIQIGLIFDFVTGQVTGYGGCNWYYAPLGLNDNDLAIDTVGSTKRFCGRIGGQINMRGLLEDEYFAALGDAERYVVNENRLRIFYRDTLILTFEANDDEQLAEFMCMFVLVKPHAER